MVFQAGETVLRPMIEPIKVTLMNNRQKSDGSLKK